jgi:hypothetical protein
MVDSHGTSSPADELSKLRADWPEYSIGTVWQARSSGPDARRYVAVKGPVILSAWSVAALAAAIRREERA